GRGTEDRELSIERRASGEGGLTTDHRPPTFNTGPRPRAQGAPADPRAWLAANGLVALAYAPWLTVLWQQARQVKESFWLAAPGPEALVTTMYSFVFAHSLADSLFGLGLFLVVLIAFLGLYHVIRRPGDRRQLLLFCLAMLLLPPVASFALSLIRPIYLDRSLIGSSFFLYIFLAWSLMRLGPDWLRLLLGGALALTIMAGLYGYYFVPSLAKPPMREAALGLAEAVKPGDVVLHASDGSFLPFVFYDGSFEEKGQHKLIAGDPELAPGTARSLALSVLGLQGEQVEDLVAGKERVWLIVALDHSVDWQLEVKRWFDQRYHLEAERNLQGIRIYLYTRPLSVIA
ncbi:MAG: hypothetical protein HYX94_08550, partial [Chloroflexi bacterium]|nr:hypothetical protein [Chloroflexota bacterium]